MPLPNISSMPETDNSRQAFDFSHYQDHVEIAQKINKTHGTKLTVYPIYPGPTDGPAWARMHQRFHDDMNSVLSLPNAQDLTNQKKDQDWHFQNYQEHLAARTKLNI